ncbi:MAG: GbpC/Spa domain-containing protein [Streptococcus sp.]
MTPLDLSKNGSVLSISSLNHWNTELGNHIEKVGLNGNEYVQIPGSSITLHEDGYAYATNDNEFVANGSRFNSDPTVIQQLVKSQMKVGMRLTQTERLVRRMPTMVLLQQSSRVNQWTLS